MYKKTLEYTDYDGNVRKEDYHFNMNKAELVDMQFSVDGGMDKVLTKIVQEKDQRRLIELFKKLIDLSYGVKSLDGKHFVKTPEALAEFKSTEAYSELFMELATNTKAATDFVNGIMPKIDNVPTEAPKITEVGK